MPISMRRSSIFADRASAKLRMRTQLFRIMKAARIHNFGGPEVIVLEDVPRPVPATGEVLVRVAAAGVGPWDALIREGKSKVSPPPPLPLGSDLSGVVEKTGPAVSQFNKGDEVYGVTNPQFVGAQAEYAVASATMIARKPLRLDRKSTR